MPNTCHFGDIHQGKEPVVVCLNAECQNKRLCCLTCVDEFHQKHELISLNKLEMMLKAATRKLDPLHLQWINATLMAHQNALQQAINLKQVETEKFFHQCRDLISKTFQDVYETINLTGSGEDLVGKMNAQLNSQSVSKYLSIIHKSKDLHYDDSAEAREKITKCQNAFIKDLNKHFSNVEAFVKNLKLSIERIPGMIGIRAKHQGIYTFSSQHKADCLLLSKNNTVVTRAEGSGGYPIALCSQKLTKQHNAISISILEQPGNKGIWLGICLLEVVANLNFLSCYGIGKGTYAIDQVGQNHTSAFSWNHHDPNYNSQPKVGFQFGIGDVITIAVDFDNSTVLFTKGDMSYKQPIKTDLGDLYAFAGPTNINDSMSLVSM